ncbi:ABC transporter ATP-binding protein [Actinobacillus succinogenes]|uniref:ABC transporter related n=1 Tax=Actinobacillus succinogenes (strain ATCC 55618 / DSM 22257 / CCUG 43843 / 130Z) TaxID=339671 RepID=A6VKE1_ACTSZ|nr:ABC transporter ATP-binding protein [Actinobacillus succinogenes]ABR73438.1 ABC transporter related [Actinobacillus succinogenes 130Z]PHI40099.1 ABC transporter ATP-binding protein [Actinobacillus succinogenes]
MKNNAWWEVAYRFKDYIRPERGLIILSLLSLLISTGARLLKPLPLAFAVDYILIEVVEYVDVQDGGIGQSSSVNDLKFDSIFNVPLHSIDNKYLLLGCAAMVVIIALLMAAGSFFSTVGLALAGSRILAKVRSDLFSHLLRLSMRFHSQAKTGDLTMRLVSDVGMLREAVITALMPMLVNVLILVGMLSVMFYLHWKLTLFAVASLPLLWVVTNRSGKKIHEVSRAQRKKEGGLASKASEYIASVRTIQSLSLEGETVRSFEGDNNASRQQEVKSKKLTAGLERRVDVLMALVTAVVLFQGANTVLDGRMSPGELIVFMSYLNNSFRPVREYAKYTARLAKALAAAERIIDLLDETPDIKDSADAKELIGVNGDIRFEHVSFGYHDKDQSFINVLRNMDFSIRAGESVAVVGPSGAGKTTITSLLLRLYEPDSGTVRIDGHDIREYTLASMRKQITVVPQDNLLFGISIRENIALGALHNIDEVTDNEIIAAAKLANAHDFISALPEGYNTVLSERGSSLSGGQRQRIAVARAAISQSPVLILDEPTVGLDRESESHVMNALHNLMQNRTTIMITHDLVLASTADRILFVENGVIAEQGSHEDLLANGKNYADWWRMQVN